MSTCPSARTTSTKPGTSSLTSKAHASWLASSGDWPSSSIREPSFSFTASSPDTDRPRGVQAPEGTPGEPGPAGSNDPLADLRAGPGAGSQGAGKASV